MTGIILLVLHLHRLYQEKHSYRFIFFITTIKHIEHLFSDIRAD